MIFLTGDLHLGHKNIISYTHRPFSTVKEMDTTIISNWNAIVKEEDVVIVLGDFCFGDPVPYLKQLKGLKIFIRGNHDRHLECVHWLILEDILLVHRPCRPFWFDGWVVHAHVHNHRPFIDEHRKLINCAVEQTGYRPVPYGFLKAMVIF